MIRSKGALFIYSLVALLFTVPWFFLPGEQLPPVVLGFPTWALYAVVASFFYAVFIAFCLGRYWDLAAGGDDWDADDPS